LNTIDGQGWCIDSTTIVFVGVCIGCCDPCSGTTNISLPVYVSSSLPITNVYWQRNIGGSTTRITTANTNTNKYNGGTINTPSLTIYSVQQSDAKRNLLITTQSD
jgi:hypothetical protein